MAFKDSLQQFKKYNRQKRVQLSEESFAKGIKFVTSPLELGYVRNIVNLDLNSDEISLTPRKGLRAFEVSQELDLESCEAYDASETYTEKQIYYATENVEEDNKMYRQVLLGNATDKSLELLTIYTEHEGTTLTPYTDSALNVLAQNTVSDDNYEYFFRTVNKAGIHGFEIADPSVLAEHIGAELSAEGSKKYYCFRKNKTTHEVEMVFTTFNTFTQKYEWEILQPYQTTAANAALSMCNMLQEDPYVFADTFTAPSLQFRGVYVTDLQGIARQATYKNTEYLFRMNYAVADGQSYKIVWEWKEPTASSFVEIETQYVTFNSEAPQPLAIKWASPVSSVILRVQAYPLDTSVERVTLKTFSNINPGGTLCQGEMYYNPDTRRIYTYNGSTWNDEKFPLTSVIYEKEDDGNKLYRWAGNQMIETDGYDYIASQALLSSNVFGEALKESTQNLDYTKYNLHTCKGMVTWGQRLCIYGPEKGQNMLFVSEPNNPAWFPFPRNISLFNQAIVKCIEYLDSLLVFTTDSIYQLVLAEGGDGWTERCLQKNLNIQDCDVHMIKLIKNMVFFKSNNHYYMVVPSSTSASGLTIAPISTNIEQLLDNFKESVDEMLAELYDDHSEYELVHYRNHVNYKNVFNIYTFKSDRGKYFNVHLIYNIASRYWYSYIIESDTLISSYKIDVSDVNIYMAYAPTILNNKLLHNIQFLKFEDIRKDFYIPAFSDVTSNVEELCDNTQFYRNYQYIDTGYREHESDFKKRYRELQFKLNNYAQVDLTFYTRFMIDGYERQSDETYEIQQIVDPNNPRYGVIEYNRVFDEDDGQYVPGATILADTATNDSKMWKLNVSEFPETVFWKSRFPVSGKGYVPRLKILSTNQEKYEILNISWVFRMLYSR